MRNTIRLIALVAITASTALAAVGATPASATTACVAGTVTAPCTGSHPGGAFALRATDFNLTVSGSLTDVPIQCSNATLSGTAPATSGTTVATPVTLAFGTCVVLGSNPRATVGFACNAGGTSAVTLNTMWNQSAQPVGAATLTIPSGCTFGFDVGVISCSLTITGPQTIGNGGSGAGGIGWTNGTASVFSHLDANTAAVTAVSSGGGFACPTAGAHAATLTATYSVTSPAPAPGVTLIS